MPQIEIISENEKASGWEFRCQVLDDAGKLHTITLKLSWADYNLWSPDGADSPQRVAEAVLDFLLMRMQPGDLRSRFDASRARTQFPDADAVIPKRIAR